MNLKTHLKFLFVLLLFITSFVKAQSLKTYNGPFKVGFGFQDAGNATYTYYEDKNTLERIKHGTFSYTLALKNNIAGTFSKKVTGSYNNGLKNHLWQYDITYVDFARTENDVITNSTGKITLTASYLNGLPNGVWVYKKKILYRDKRYVLDKAYVTPYKLREETSISVSFKNGVFSGPIIINNNNFSVTGSFDANGNLDGHWIIKGQSNEEVTDYKNGLVIRRINRSLPNGEILEKEIDDTALQLVKQNYLNGSLSENDIIASGKTFEKRNVFKEKSIRLTENIFNDDDFMYTTLLGDKLIQVNADGNFTIDKIKYNGGDFFKINSIKFSDLKDDYNFTTAEKNFNNADYETARKYYLTIVQNQGYFPVSPKDLEYVQKQIIKIDSLSKKNQRKKPAIDRGL